MRQCHNTSDSTHALKNVVGSNAFILNRLVVIHRGLLFGSDWQAMFEFLFAITRFNRDGRASTASGGTKRSSHHQLPTGFQPGTSFLFPLPCLQSRSLPLPNADPNRRETDPLPQGHAQPSAHKDARDQHQHDHDAQDDPDVLQGVGG